MRRPPEDRRARRLGGEPLRRVDLRDALTERLDDAPAARVGARRHRERRRSDHPGRRSVEIRAQVAGRDQRERDDPHRLLGVVRPCVNATKPPETSCSRPEPAVDPRGGRRAMNRVITTISTKAIATPRNGAMSDGMSTLSLRPPPVDDVRCPSAAMAEPTMPPIRAWLELDGSPTNQVMRFHVIAPTRPARTSSA